ncbi:hypothetical protein [Sinomicrobium sp.]
MLKKYFVVEKAMLNGGLNKLIAISKLNRLVVVLFVSVSMLYSCDSEKKQKERMKKVQEECTEKTHMDGLHIGFLGYEYDELRGIAIIQKNKRSLSYRAKVKEAITDSLRERRELYWEHKIGLNDTLVLILPTGESHRVCNFKYVTKPTFGMFSKEWTCVLDEMEVDGVVRKGSELILHKEGFKVKSAKSRN